MKCPLKSHPDWKALELLVGKDQAYAIWMKNGEEIPKPSEFKNFTDWKPVESPKVLTNYSLQSSEGLKATEKTLRDLASRIADRIGFNVQFTTNSVANWKGKLDGKTAHINLAHATLDTPIHEILGHPIIRAIKQADKKYSIEKSIDKHKIINDTGEYFTVYSKKNEEYDQHDHFDTLEEASNYVKKQQENLTLYNNLLKELESGIGKEVLDRIKRDYASKNEKATKEVNESLDLTKELVRTFTKLGKSDEAAEHERLIRKYERDLERLKYTLDEQEEEAIVELLGLMTADKLDKSKDASLIALLKQLLKEISDFIGILIKSKEIKIADLDKSLMINDLANILAYSNSKLILPGQEVVYITPDNKKFRTYAEASKYISDLSKAVKDIDLSNVSLEKPLTKEDLEEIARHERDITSVKNRIKSEEYQEDKRIRLESLKKKLKEKQEVPNTFKFQEPYTSVKGYENARVQHTESPIRQGDHSKLLGKYKGYYIHAYIVGGDTTVIPISDVQAYKIWIEGGSDLDHKLQQEISQIINDLGYIEGDRALTGIINESERNIKVIKNTNLIGNFIKRNLPFEQSKIIIERWKEVNNIEYNPEEVYSRGQGFFSVVGAYSDLDINLLFQNLLEHIADNQKAGGEFVISAFTRSVDKKLQHLDGIDGKVRFNIVPKSQDIKWAANTDVYSGSVWDASQTITTKKKSEVLGVSYTKAPGLLNLKSIQVNLANVIDNIAHAHNELGIALTTTNFRLEYDEDIPFKTKKLINNINNILDQKYGKLVKPDYNAKTVTKYKINDVAYDTREKAEAFIDNWKSDEGYELVTPFTIKEIQVVQGIQPKITEDKTSLASVAEEVIGYTPSDYYNENDIYESPEENEAAARLREEKQKQFNSQAYINKKIALLKENPKKYPRALIRSEIISAMDDIDSHFWDNETQDIDLFHDELPFQKVPSVANSADEGTGITNPDLKELTKDLFVPGFSAHLQDQATQHIFEHVITYIDDLQGASFNDGIKDWIEFAQEQIDITKDEKFIPILENIDAFRLLVKDRLDRLGLLTTKILKDDDIVEVGETGDPVSDAYRWEDNWVYKFDAKGNALHQVKKFLVFIPKVEYKEGKYEIITNYLKTVSHMSYDVVFEDLKAILADKGNKWEVVRKVLEEHQQAKPWIKGLLYRIDSYKDDKEQLINQFVSTFSNTASNFKTLLWNTDKGAFVATLVDSDRNSAIKVTIAKWQDNFNQSKILTETENGELVAVKEELEEVIKQLKELKTSKTNVRKFLASLGIDVLDQTVEQLLLGNVGGLTFEEHFTAKRGLFYNISNRLLGNDNLNLEGNDIINPIINNSGARSLAATEVKYNDAIFSNSLINGEGNTVNSYAFNKFLTRQLRKLSDPNYVNQLSSLDFQQTIVDEDKPIYKNWIWQIQNNPLFLKNFEIGAFDTTRKQTTFDKGVMLTNMADIDLELTKTTAFQNEGAGVTGLGRLANYLFTVPSKTTSFMITAPTIALDETFGTRDTFSKTTRDALYSIALSELNRINASKTRKIKTKKYKSGSKFFYFLPALNKDTTPQIWNPDGTMMLPSTKVGDLTVEDIIRNIIETEVRQNVENKINDWKSMGFIEDDEFLYMDTKYKKLLTSKTALGKQKVAALDYIVNNMLFKFNMHQIFIGDPAIYFKETVEVTWDEIGKRLAAMIAPGKDPSLASENELFLSIKVKDREGDIALNSKQLIERLGEKAGKAYRKLNGTDAAEWITLWEKLTMLKRYGQISTKMYDDISARHKKDPDNLILTDKELAIVFQPDKPVYVNSTIDLKENALILDYVKSSSLPLIPQYTQGLDIDKVRIAMEKLEDRAKLPVRLAFDSTTKLGGTVSIDIFTEDGGIKDDLDFSEYNKKYFRSGISIQQEVPNDPNHDLTVKGSQPTKLLFDNILELINFQYKTKGDVTGGELIEKWNQLHNRLFEYTKDKLHEEILDPITKELDLVKVNKLLKKEAISRSYTPAELASLNLLLDNSFEYPFWAITSSKKYEAILTSLYTNNVIKQKMHGTSLVLVPEEGMRGKSKGITYTKSYDPLIGLKPMRIEIENGKEVVKGGQVLLPWKFKESIKNFVDADNYIDITKIDPELLEQFGFRIPTQGHNSMSLIEVVGFLPKGSNHVVASRNFITQMGSDFDVDKLYIYDYFYINENGVLKRDWIDNINATKNDILDIHKTVLKHVGVFNQVTRPLENVKDTETAIYLKEKNKKKITNYLSPDYDKNKYLESIDGKAMISINALSNTLNSIIQGHKLIYTTTKGKENYIVFGDDKGKKIERSDLSDPLTHRGRLKSHVISGDISASVDNEKDPILAALNNNPITAPALIALRQLGYEEDHYDMLLGQGIIKEFTKEVRKRKSSINAKGRNIEKTIISNLKHEASLAYFESLTEEEQKEYDEGKLLFYPLTVKQMKENLNKPTAWGDLVSILKFEQAYYLGESLQAIQKAINIESKGIGKSVLELALRARNLNNLLKIKDIKNVTKLLGTYTGTEITNPTYTGSILKHGLQSANEKLGGKNNELFKYNSRAFKKILLDYENIYGLPPTVEQTSNLWNEFKSYLFASRFTVEERKNLFYGKNTLAKRIKKYLYTKEGRVNPFLIRLTFETKGGRSPDHVFYNAAKEEYIEELSIYQGLITLLTSTDKEAKQIGEDLVTYFYINGGIQEAKQWGKYIHPAYLKMFKNGTFLNFLRETNFSDELIAGSLNNGIISDFTIQYFQHNSYLLPTVDPKNKAVTISATTNKVIIETSITAEIPPLIPDLDGLYPAMMSIKTRSDTDNGYKVYLKESQDQNKTVYTRVSELGAKFLTEYSKKSKGGTSVINRNFEAKTVALAPNNKNKKINNTKTISTETNRKKYEGTVKEVLSSITSEKWKPLADFLNKLTYTNTVKVDQTISDAGIIDGKTGNIKINPTRTNDPERVVIHEVIHAKTVRALVDQSTLTPEQARAAKALNTIADNIRARTLSGELEYAGFIASELLEFEQLLKKQISNIPLTPEEEAKRVKFRPLYYGLTLSKFNGIDYTSFEYVTELLTAKKFQEALNRVKYSGNITLLERIINLIIEIMTPQGVTVEKGSILEASLHEVLFLIDSQKAKERKVTIDNTRTDQLPEDLTLNSIADTIKDPYKKFAIEYETRLRVIDAAMAIAYQQKDLIEVQRLQNKKDEIEENLYKLDEDQVFETVLEIGKKDLDNLTKFLKQPNLSSTDINYALKVIGLWLDADKLLLEESDVNNMTKRAIDVETKLVSRAGLLYNVWNNISRKSLLAAIQKTSGLDNLTEEVLNAQNKISGITAAMMDISRSGNIILDVMSYWIRESTFKANTEADIIQDELEKLAKNLEKVEAFRKDKYYTFAQKTNDGALTGEIVQPLTPEYYSTRQALITKYQDEGNKQKREIYKEEFFDWLRDNHSFIDIRKLFIKDEEGIYTYKHNAEYIKQLRKVFRNEKLEDYLVEQKDLIKLYNEKLRSFTASLDKDDPDAFRQINKWKLKNDPSIYLRNTIDNNYITEKVDGVAVNNIGYLYVLSRTTKKWEDEQYNKIQNQPDLKVFYDYSIKTLNNLYGFLPPSFKQGIISSHLPDVSKQLVEIYREQGMSAALTGINNNFKKAISIEEPPENTRQLQDPITKKLQDTLQVQYLTKLTPEEKSFDLHKVISLFAYEALAFKHKSQVEDQIKLAYSILEQGIEVVKHPSGRNMIDRFKQVVTIKDGENLRKQAEYAIKGFYGQRKINQGVTKKKVYLNKAKSKHTKMLLEAGEIKDEKLKAKAIEKANLFLETNTRFVVQSKIGDVLLKYMQLKGMGWNVFGSVTNITFGWISNLIHSYGSTDFTTNQLLTANRLMLASTAKGVGISNELATKISKLMRKYKVLKEFNNVAYDAVSGGNKVREGMEKIISPFELQQRGEYFVQGMTMIASMLNTKVTINGVETNLWDAYDNNANFKEPGNTDWNGDVNNKEDNKLLYQFKFKLDQVNKLIHGNYDPDSLVRIKSGILGRIVMQFRSWIAEGVANRWEDKKYDMFLKRDRQGRWQTYGDLGFKKSFQILIKLSLKQDISNLVDSSELALVTENMKRNLGEIHAKLGLIALYLLFQGIDLDDDDDYAKKARNLAFNQILRLQDDIEFFYSPLAAENIVQNFVPMFNIVKDAYKFYDAFSDGVVNGEWEYTHGRRAGQDRLLWTGAKLFPFGSTTVSFINKMEGEEGYRKK